MSTTNRFGLILGRQVATGDTILTLGEVHRVERVVIRLRRSTRPPSKCVRFRIRDVKGVRIFFDGKVRELGPKDRVLVRKAA